MEKAKVNWEGSPIKQAPKPAEPLQSFWGESVNKAYTSNGETQKVSPAPTLPPYETMSTAERDLLEERYEFLNSQYMDSSLSETKRDRAYREAQELMKQAFGDTEVTGSGELRIRK
jgi:hypothetical protein